MTPSTTHRAALTYAGRFGFFVFPIKPGTKAPHGRFVRHGFQDATRDPEQIGLWWSADPSAGVAIACVTSGLVVLDVDPRNGGDETLAMLEGEIGALPTTPRVLTPSGGQHIYFHDDVGAYAGTAGEGLDVKSSGYVLAPPSVHPNGGVYRWDVGAHLGDTDIAPLPDVWLRRVTTPAHAKTSGPVLPSSGLDAADSWLGHAFAAEGWLGDSMRDGRRMVRCPWARSHSDGRGDGNDSSAILFPRAAGRTLGSFRCSHGHCAGRTWTDVVEVLSRKAKWVADEAMRAERNRLALEKLASQRKAG
jgi:hypothetical protein